MPSSIIALFCEDIRFEHSGQHSLIGLLPDNVVVPKTPGAMAKLGVFIRAQVETQAAPPQITLSFKNTDGSDIELPSWDMTTIANAKTDAEGSNSPTYGLIITAVISPFRVPTFGTAIVSAKIDGVSYIAGVVNFIPANATASEQPSSQSRNAS